MSEPYTPPSLTEDFEQQAGDYALLKKLAAAVERERDAAQALADHARAARDFLADVRKTAGEAYRIRVGCAVRVVGGRRVPYGRYKVLAHYQRTAGSEFDGCVLTLVSYEGKKFARVSVYDCRVIPDYAPVFKAWGHMGPVLAGCCDLGFDHTAVLVLCDWIDEYGFGSCPWFDGHVHSEDEDAGAADGPACRRVVTLDPGEFTKQLRGIVGTAVLPDGRMVLSLGLGPIQPSEGAQRWNMYRSR